MKARLLLGLALVFAAVAAGIVLVAGGFANMTPDDELRFHFLLLDAAVLLSAAFIIEAVGDLRRAVAGPGGAGPSKG